MKPTLAQVSELARAYLAKHMTGGALHIVLEDGNVEDSHVAWCDGYAAGIGDEEGKRLAAALRPLTEQQRRALYLADWHVPDQEQIDIAREDPDEARAVATDTCDALQAEIDRRGRLIEEQERDLAKLRAELDGANQLIAEYHAGRR